MSKKKKWFCVQYYLMSDRKGRLVPDHVWVQEIGDAPAPCSGRGHNVPGCSRHVYTTSPVQALRRALGWSYRRSKEHVEWQQYQLEVWRKLDEELGRR